MATTKVDVGSSTWADLGPSPCFLQITDGGPLYFVIDSAAPSGADLATTHVLGEWRGSLSKKTFDANVGISGRVYGRTAPGQSATVVVSR